MPARRIPPRARLGTPMAGGPAQLRAIFRDLVRAAVAASTAGTMACSAHHMGQDVPASGAGGSATVAGQGAGGPAGAGGVGAPVAGSAGSVAGAGGGTTAGAGGGAAAGGSTLGGSGGGGGSGGAPVPATAPWMAIDCSPSMRLLDGLSAVYEPDFAARYRIYGGLADPRASPGFFGSTQVESEGSPCATAADFADCQAQLVALSEVGEACVQAQVCDPYLVTTQGEAVRRHDGIEGLLEFLGEIDTPHEAALLLLFAGHEIPCPAGDLSGTSVREAEGGYDVKTEWDQCSGDLQRQITFVGSDGSIEVESTEVLGHSNCVVGRRPAALADAAPAAMGSALGTFFANAAHLEAASVFAFERLARELTHHDAPAALVADAVRSAVDEIRHAREVALLARRFGGEPSVPRVVRGEVRGLFEVALENAVEGCVRETFGALVATHQAATATDPAVRAALAGIAEDETRHAALAWRVAEWIEPQLDAEAGQALAGARAAAVAELYRQLDQGLAPHDAARIGWPAPEVAEQLLAGLVQRLA